MHGRFWNGKTVHIKSANPAHDRRTLEIAVTPETGSKLALALKRLEQTYFDSWPQLDELKDALDYVLIGDPVSTAKHKQMEAGKGMEPAAGDTTSYAPQGERERNP